jgi:DNA-binding NarL/FixJ family response regulator
VARRVSCHPEERRERLKRTEVFIKEGWTNRQIAQELRVTDRTINRYRDDLGLSAPAKRMTPEEIALAEQMLDDGASYAEVARTLNRPTATIANRFTGRSKWTPTMGQHYRWARQRLEAL